MLIDIELLDNLSVQAKASPRLRMNYDLRDWPYDGYQRMLNGTEAGSSIYWGWWLHG